MAAQDEQPLSTTSPAPCAKVFEKALGMLHVRGEPAFGHDNAIINEMTRCIDLAPQSSYACCAHFVNARLYERSAEYHGKGSSARNELLAKELDANCKGFACMGLQPINPGRQCSGDVAMAKRIADRAFVSVELGLAAVLDLENKYTFDTLGSKSRGLGDDGVDESYDPEQTSPSHGSDETYVPEHSSDEGVSASQVRSSIDALYVATQSMNQPTGFIFNVSCFYNTHWNSLD